MKRKKTKLILSSLIISLSLSGCSFNLVNRFDNRSDVKVKYDTEMNFDNDSIIDESLGLKSEISRNIDYSYLIDKSDYTNKTLAHVIDEKTISSEKKWYEFNKEIDYEKFDEALIQPIVLPISFTLYQKYKISDLLDAYGKCDINCKKLYTLEGDILYYIESTFTFNKFAEDVIDLGITNNSTMQSQVLYKLNDYNNFTILYENQTGIKEDTSNVVEKNFNNEKELLIPIEKTDLNSLHGIYEESELQEEINLQKYK